MARRKGVMASLAQIQREQMRAAAARDRAQAAAARRAAAAQRDYDRASRATEKERRALYVAKRLADVELETEQLHDAVRVLTGLLAAGLSQPAGISFDQLKIAAATPVWTEAQLQVPEPAPLPPAPLAPPSGLAKLSKGAKQRYDAAQGAQAAGYQQALNAHQWREQQRMSHLNAAWGAYQQAVFDAEAKAASQHAEIDALRDAFLRAEPEAVMSCHAAIIDRSHYPDGIPNEARLAYVPESRQLVVEYELPTMDVVPEVAEYRYVKTTDKVTAKPRPVAQRRALYSSSIAQLTLRCLHELFSAAPSETVETVVFNGHVATIDPGTGQPIHPCLVTVRATRDDFQRLDLSRVDPAACLRTLNASLSKSPDELRPVRPVLEFSMVDPRFVEEQDVLSTLDSRPNLMELTPGEFENLITNLFEKMGLETRQTQASRDGGVDCVAFNTEPILGGKVVIQAKRYKHTVGVSAVRDLFGTVQNEGASKGILVTTSGYGKASFAFAEGKPLELLSGSHLLYLLAEHSGIEAKIVPPEDWTDPQPDTAPTQD